MGYRKEQLLYAAMYLASCRTANIERYVDTLASYENLQSEVTEEGLSDFLVGLAGLARRVDHDDVIVNEEQANRRLIAEDLRRLAAVDLTQAGLSTSVEDGITKAVPLIHDRLAEIGLHLSSSELFVVDSFPAPFDRFDWAAFAPDSEDERDFGIPRGVYFRRSRLRPLYSEALYAHEAIHTITGTTDPEVYAAGLEEGIAEIIGTCYGGLAVLTPEVLKNLMVYGRHGVERPAMWSLYRDHMRQAFLLYREFGLHGLAELVTRGRAAIHEIATEIATGEYRNIGLPRGGFDLDTTNVAEFACLGFIPSHTYSPLECLLTQHVRSGLTITEICGRAGVDPRIGEAQIRSVSASSALFMLNGNSIGYSIVERLLTNEERSGVSLLRYLPLG